MGKFIQPKLALLKPSLATLPTELLSEIINYLSSSLKSRLRLAAVSQHLRQCVLAHNRNQRTGKYRLSIGAHNCSICDGCVSVNDDQLLLDATDVAGSIRNGVRILVDFERPVHLMVTFQPNCEELQSEIAQAITASSAPSIKELAISISANIGDSIYYSPALLTRQLSRQLTLLCLEIKIEKGAFSLFTQVRANIHWLLALLPAISYCTELQVLIADTDENLLFLLSSNQFLGKLTSALQPLKNIRALLLPLEASCFGRLLKSLSAEVSEVCFDNDDDGTSLKMLELEGGDRVRGNIRRLCCVHDQYFRDRQQLQVLMAGFPNSRQIAFCSWTQSEPLEMERRKVDEICGKILDRDMQLFVQGTLTEDGRTTDGKVRYSKGFGKNTTSVLLQFRPRRMCIYRRY